METLTPHQNTKKARVVFLLATAHHSFKKADRFDWYLQQVLEHKSLLKKRIQTHKEVSSDLKNDSKNVDNEDQQQTKIEEANETETQSKSQESLNDDAEHSSSKNDQQDDSQPQDESDNEEPTDEQQQSENENHSESEHSSFDSENSDKDAETDNTEEDEDSDAQPFDIYNTLDENDQLEIPVANIENVDEYYVEVGFQPYENVAVLYAASRDGSVYSQCHTIASKNNLFHDTCTISTPLLEPSDIQEEIHRNNVELSRMQLASDAQVFVIYTKYRMVISLDISPSTSLVCESGAGKLIFDNLFASLQYTLRSAVQPLEFQTGADSSFKVSPIIYITVTAQGAILEGFHLLLEGAKITASNVETTLTELKQSLYKLKSHFADSQSNDHPNINSPQHTLQQILQTSVFALKLMAPDAAPVLIVINDGVTQLTLENGYDNLVMLLSREDIPCCVDLDIMTNNACIHGPFAYVPDLDLMKFLGDNTGGHLLSSRRPQGFSVDRFLQGSSHRSSYSNQERLMLRPLHPYRNFLKPNVSDTPQSDLESSYYSQEVLCQDIATLNSFTAIDYPYPWSFGISAAPPPVPLLPSKLRKYNIEIDPFYLISTRLNEGFFVNNVTFHADSKLPFQFDIQLMYLWQRHIYFVYNVKVQNGSLLIELEILSYYEFLLQFATCLKQNTIGNVSAAGRFHTFVHNVIECDRVTSYIGAQIVPAMKELYTAHPKTVVHHDSTSNHINPLNLIQGLTFGINMGFTPTAKPVQNIPNTSQDTDSRIKLWKLIVSNIQQATWHRWLQTEKVELLLSPVAAKPLQEKESAYHNSSTEYHSIGFDSIVSANIDKLTHLLENFFIQRGALVSDNKAYLFMLPMSTITFRAHHRPQSSPPAQTTVHGFNIGPSAKQPAPEEQDFHFNKNRFYVIRFVWDCTNMLVVQFAFYCVESSLRQNIIRNFRHEITSPRIQKIVCAILTAPILVPTTPSFQNQPNPNAVYSYTQAHYVHPPKLEYKLHYDHEATLLCKDIRSILIRYGLPSEPPKKAVAAPASTSVPVATPSALLNANISQFSSIPGLPMVGLLKNYMFHQRWIWHIDTIQTRDMILDLITKATLHEGFILVNSSNTINFVRVITMVNNANVPPEELYRSSNTVKSVLQYLVYKVAPQLIVTELWMEPQSGYLPITDSSDKPKFINQHEIFQGISQWLRGRDEHIMSSLCTFDTLLQFAKFVPTPVTTEPKQKSSNLVSHPFAPLSSSLSAIPLSHSPITSKVLSPYLFRDTEKSRKEKERDSELDDTRNVDSLEQRPPFSLGGILGIHLARSATSCAEKSHLEQAYAILKNNQTSNALSPANELLYLLLKTAVGSLSNCEISLPTDDSSLQSLGLQHCYCFEKVINSETLILTFVWPFQAAEERFKLTFYECSRECLQDLQLISSTSPLYMSTADPNKSVVISLRQALQESHDQCQHFHGHTNGLHQIYRHHHHAHHHVQTRHRHHTKLKGKTKPHVQTSTQRRHKRMKSKDVLDESMDFGQSSGLSVSKLYYESIRASHQRSFVKVVYSNLRDSTSIHFDDFCTAISSCQEYVLKIDITQYIKIVHLHLLEGKGMPEPLSLHVPPFLQSQLSSQAASIQEKFNQLVKKQFQRVPVSGIDNYFFYMSILSPTQQIFPTKMQPQDEPEIEEIENEDDDDIVDEDEETPPVPRKKGYNNSNDTQNPEAWDLEWAFTTTPTSKSKPGPSFAQTLKKKLSADEKTSLGVFPFPLFLRLECQIVPEAPNSVTDVQKLIQSQTSHSSGSSSLSNSATLQLSGGSASENDNNNDQHHVFSFPTVERFPINTMPTPSTHPNIRADTKVYLRFICVTLPPFKNSVLSQTQSTITGTKRTLSQSQSNLNLNPSKDALSFHELPLQPLKKIIRDTETSVRYLLSEEILNSLRDSRPVTKHTLDIVVEHMSKLKSQSLSTFTIPLYFLDVREGRKVFPTELETTAYLSLKRIHDVYFIVQKSKEVEGENPKPDNSDEYVIPYWAIITYHQREGLTGDFVKVLFYSNSISNVDKSQLFTEVRTGIRRVCERVNQLFLLHQLHETRYCSPLLVPNATEESPAQSSTPTSISPTASAAPQKAPLPRPLPQSSPSMAQHTVFLPGQFACPLVHTIKLGLHPRVPAVRAVGALISTALHPFSVSDRKNLFVFHEKTGRVFYMKLQDSASGKKKEDGEDSSGSGSFGSQLSITGSSFSSLPKSNSATNLNLADPTMNATLIQRAQFLTLEVFGVDKPSSEITEQLHKLLESKLASITLSLLSTLLERNPHLKLTPEDIEFIRGSVLEPSKTLEFTLPPHIKAFSFFKYLKQNLLQYLTLMHSSSDADVRANFLSSFCRRNLSEIAERSDFECNMIYNYITNRKTASPICSAIGQGVAIIRVSLLDSNPGVAKEIIENKMEPEQVINWAEKCLSIKPSEDICKMESAVTGNEIVVEIWARETLLNIQALVAHLTQSFNQTICEFSLESFLGSKNFNVNQLQEELIQPSKLLASTATALNTPSVTELKADLTVPSWAMHNFVLEIQDILLDLNSKLAPVVCFSENMVPKQPCTYLPYATFMNNNPNTNILLKKKGYYQFAIVGGCVTLTEDGNVISAPSPYLQSQPITPSSSSGTLHGTFSPGMSPLSPPSSSTPPNPKKDETLTKYSIDEALLYPHIKEGNQVVYRNCFVLLTITNSKLELLAYNWNHAKWEQLNFMFSKLKSWVSMRQNLLHNILHQKLGLFYHSPSSYVTPKTGTTNSETVKFTLDNIDLLLNNPSPSRTTKEDSNTQLPSSMSKQLPKKKPSSLLNFPTILANPHAFEPTNVVHMNIQDPVKRHGVQLRTIAASLERISDMKTNLMFLYNSWPRYSQAMLSPSPSSYQTLLTPSGEKLDVVTYLRLVMKASNIIACSRCSLLFDQQCGLVITRTTGDPVFSSIITKSKEMLQDNSWYKNLLAAFVLNLQSNLTSLAFHELKVHELVAMAAPNSNANTSISDPSQITIKDSYFVKNSRGGSILVHLSYDHPFLSLDIFALHGLKQKSSTSGMMMPFLGTDSSKNSKQSFMQFAEELTKPKLSLHTFLFDFHLKKIQQYLTAGEESYPPLEFIKLLNSMVLHYPVSPRRSQSAILCRTITASLTSTLNSEQVTLSSGADLFAYISNNAQKYRLKSMTQFGIVPGLYLGSDSDSISINIVFGILTDKDTLSTYSHSVIIFMLPESKNGFSLDIQFYLVRTCSTSSLLFNDSNNTRPPLDDIADHIQSYLLNQVFPQAVLDFKRDMLWKLLVTPPDNNTLLSPLNVEQFTSLKNLSSNRVVQNIDPALTNLLGLSNLPCPALINHLVSVYGKTVRKQPIKGTILSLVITNPQYADSFLHIYVEEGKNKVHITVSRREVPINPEMMTLQVEQECSQITKLANHILFFLWKCLVL